ncbi:MAG: DNA polymerase I [Bacteroidales bacterium]|nr:DNA polymerase I [Bacteroidales bacterium]
MDSNKVNTLYLIDGHALVFRMYYALLRRPMVNSKGTDTSILYGFTKYILELIEKEKPSHLAVSFDPPGGTFRNQLYPEYKANRDATPQLIIDALGPLTELCEAMRIPVLMIPGFEADDVIGSMAKRAEKEGFEVYMVTPDKDYGQLISKHIHQYKPGKSGAERELVDEAAVCARYGIDSPLQVIDMLAICGDASDNVPGVKGVGEVGASKLIAKYGSLENIYAHIGELSPKQGAMFEAARGHIDLSKVLVTIKTDIELEAKTEDMILDGRVSSKIFELIDFYEMGSLKRYLKGCTADDGSVAPAEPESAAVELNFTETDAASVCAMAAKSGECAVSINGGEVTLAAEADGVIAAAKGHSSMFRQCLGDAGIKKYCCEIKEGLKSVDIEGTLMDVALMDYVINPEKSHKLDSLCKSVLGVSLETKAEEAAPLSLFDEIPEEDTSGSLLETAAILKLGQRLLKDLGNAGLETVYLEIEAPLIKVLCKMEQNGIKMDLGSLREFADKLRHEVEARQTIIRSLADDPQLNISSPKQIAGLIYDKLQLLPRKKKGNDSTDEETLLSIADRHPVVSEILEYRAAKKLLSTYIEPFPEYISRLDGKIHTTFNQALTATGRLSSSKPNLQNIPIRTERGKEIRKAFVPSTPEGIIVSADYSQIELRIMAHLSQDGHLLEAFNSGIDVHKATAAKIFRIDPSEVTADQRRVAKTANFGIMYGISAFGLAQRLGCARGEAKQIIDDYFASFPTIRDFIDRTLASARENGYVETIYGRRRYVPDVNAQNGTVRALAERNAVNAPIQGTSADIIKKAMIEVDRRMTEAGLKSRMVLQIHDELVFDALPQELETLERIVVEGMENIVKLSVSLNVECNHGKNWLEAH